MPIAPGAETSGATVRGMTGYLAILGAIAIGAALSWVGAGVGLGSISWLGVGVCLAACLALTAATSRRRR